MSEKHPRVFQLVYVSTVSRPLGTPDLLEILASARKRNAELGVTGALLYRADHFIQVLEGQEREVRELLELINGDPRHRHLRVIHEGEVGEREFPEWTMGFADLSLSSLHLEGFNEILNQPGYPLPAYETSVRLSTSEHLLRTFRRALADPLAAVY